MQTIREVIDSAGERWEAQVISHGRTSAYLNPKVHRPIVQFTCRSRRLAARYAPLPEAVTSLNAISVTQLQDLFESSKPH